ncbi:DUF397 domain-containing protein [Streptomyces sp. NBC_01218]|nr:DUF397 domain-containing protein [Streptomyces sp. NBC_01218]
MLRDSEDRESPDLALSPAAWRDFVAPAAQSRAVRPVPGEP